MSQYLAYSTISNQVKFEMGNQAPSEPKILTAVNAEVRNLNTKYDIDSFIKTETIDVDTDGKTEYRVDTVIGTDVRKVLTLRYSDSSQDFGALDKVDYDEFMDCVFSLKLRNIFTVYYKDGYQYLRVMTTNNSSVAEEMIVRYITSDLAIDNSGNFYPEVQSGGNLSVLLLDTYLDLVALGAMKRLFYPSIGESDQTQVAIIRNRYDSELKKLGLSDNATTIARKSNKIKLHA